jgi:transposase
MGGRRETSVGWVAEQKRLWRRDNPRGRRPAVWSPGEHLVIDWGVLSGLHVFCAVLAFSRVRFVRIAEDERADTTMAMLADCFETLGGVPRVVLADRMGRLKGGVVANVVVPTPDYVRFAAHYGFRPDFCEAADPKSKGIVENLVGYAKTDLMIPGAGPGVSHSSIWPRPTPLRSNGAPMSTAWNTARSGPCRPSGS